MRNDLIIVFYYNNIFEYKIVSYVIVLLYSIIIRYIVLRLWFCTLNVGGIPHLIRKLIAQGVDTSTLEMGMTTDPL